MDESWWVSFRRPAVATLLAALRPARVLFVGRRLAPAIYHVRRNNLSARVMVLLERLILDNARCVPTPLGHTSSYRQPELIDCYRMKYSVLMKTSGGIMQGAFTLNALPSSKLEASPHKACDWMITFTLPITP